MTQENQKRTRFIYEIVLSLMLIAVGVCMIVSCIAIYHSGERPFSRESVAAYFDRIDIFVYICIAAVVGGLVLKLVLPINEPALKGATDPEDNLSRLSRRLDYDMLNNEALSYIRRERNFRFLCRTICAILCIACAIPVALYLFTPANFSMDSLNGDVFDAMLFSVCFFLDGVVLCIAEGMLRALSVQKETELVKAAMKQGAILKTPRDADDDWTKWGRALTRIFGTLIAALSIIIFFTTLLRINGFISASVVSTVLVISAGVSLLVFLTVSLYTFFFAKETDIDWSKIGLFAIRALVLAVGIAFVIAGIVNGGMADVLAKAVRICTECIGLG